MISFGNATGNLFNCLGKCGLVVKQAKSYQTSQQTNLVSTSTGLVAQMNAEPDIQAVVGSQYMGVLNSMTQAGGLASSVAILYLNRKIFEDNPQPNQSLTSLNTPASIVELIRQMKVAGQSVLAMTIGATPTAFTGTGNGAVVASTRRPSDGAVLENAFAETLDLTCIGDSYSSTATAGNEPFSVTGESSVSVFAYNWPQGSNASASLLAIDGSANNARGNLLNNSDFETWAGGIPSKWTLDVGTAGTNIAQNQGLVYSGASSLQILGDGSTLTQLNQQFNTSAGTSTKLSPQTQYGVNLWLQRDAVVASNGVLQVSLVDGNNNVINDQQGNANSFNIDLTALTTSWVAYNGMFRTPVIMPAKQYLRLALTTALTNGRSVYLDKLSMGTATQIYTGGPFLTVHSGNVAFQISDYANVAVTNSRGVAGTLSTFQTLLYQLLPDVAANEFIFPSSATPTLSDGTLIA